MILLLSTEYFLQTIPSKKKYIYILLSISHVSFFGLVEFSAYILLYTILYDRWSIKYFSRNNVVTVGYLDKMCAKMVTIISRMPSKMCD